MSDACSGQRGPDPCPNEARRSGKCWSCLKREQRLESGETDLPATAGTVYQKGPGGRRTQKSARDRLREAARRWAEAESEEEFVNADQNLIKSALALREVTPPRVGRPRKVDMVEVAILVKRLGGVRPAADRLGVSVRTVKRALSQHRRAVLKSKG